jgi:hypothetical protein
MEIKNRIIKELFTNPNRSNTNIAREILPNGLHRDIEKLRKQVCKLRNSEVINNNYYTNDTYLPDDEIYTEPMVEALQKSGYNVTGTNDYICNKNNMIKLPNNVLVIPDLHLPFSTDSHLQHCVKMKEKYKCGKVIFIGDIVDNHYSSFHTANPDELSAGQELDLVKLQIKKWHSYFPEATWIMGNHDAIPQRKFAEAKLSKQWLKGFNEVLGVNWDIRKSLVYNGVYYVHGEAMTAKAMAGKIGMPVVQGHRHSETYIQYLSQKIWALQSGICFNKYTYASDYAKESTETWVETVIVVEDKTPHIIAML